jgi:hypothetical protein
MRGPSYVISAVIDLPFSYSDCESGRRRRPPRLRRASPRLVEIECLLAGFFPGDRTDSATSDGREKNMGSPNKRERRMREGRNETRNKQVTSVQFYHQFPR